MRFVHKNRRAIPVGLCLLAAPLLLCCPSLAAADPPADQTAKQSSVRTTALTVPEDKPHYYCWEPHIAVDPENPQRIIVAAIFRGQIGEGEKARADSRLLIWQSENGGRSWSPARAPFRSAAQPALRIGADPVVAFGNAKTCWFTGCDYDWKIPGQPNYSSIKVCRSEDGGKSWKTPLAADELDNGKHGKGIVDKPWLVVDTSEGKHRGTLYVEWSRLDEERKHCELRCRALPPGARQFAASVRLGEPIALHKGSALIHQVQLAVRPDGTLDAVWRLAPSSRLVHAFSRDGAATFSKPVPISGDEKNGVGEFPSLTAAPDGKLLVAWTNGSEVLYSVRTSGRWSSPRALDGALGEGTHLSYPAVASAKGLLWMLAYRQEAQPPCIRVVLYRSTDQGKSWKEDKILASRKLAGGGRRPFVPGDYVGLAAAKGVVCAAYVLPGEDRKGAKPQLYVSVFDPSAP